MNQYRRRQRKISGLLTRKSNLHLSKSIFDNQVGVYFMLDEHDKVIYIGQTKHFINRVLNHKCQKMPFHKVRLINCSAANLLYYEQRWIKKFKPFYNYSHNPKKNNRNGYSKTYYKKTRNRDMVFRKLAEQSYIGFGHYKTYKVADLLRLKREAVLAQFYYGCSHISFLPHILEILKITGEWVIEKPGKNDDLFFMFCEEFYPEYVEYKKRKSSRDMYEKQVRNIGRAKKLTNSKALLMQQNRTRK